MTDVVDPAIVDEVRETLRHLVDEIHAAAARIVVDRPEAAPAPVADTDAVTETNDAPVRTLALGGGEYLRVELREESESVDIEVAFEHATRQLRAIRRRWEVANLPQVSFSRDNQPAHDVVKDRIIAYMKGLASIDRASNAFVILDNKLIASAMPPDEGEAARWPFLARRALSTHKPNSSHGEIVDPDAYARSFWYDAALVVLLAEPYAIDFVRHRCRQVCRELANLLPLLEPDPGGPAAIRRRPPTLP